MPELRIPEEVEVAVDRGRPFQDIECPTLKKDTGYELVFRLKTPVFKFQFTRESLLGEPWGDFPEVRIQRDDWIPALSGTGRSERLRKHQHEMLETKILPELRCLRDLRIEQEARLQRETERTEALEASLAEYLTGDNPRVTFEGEYEGSNHQIAAILFEGVRIGTETTFCKGLSMHEVYEDLDGNRYTNLPDLLVRYLSNQACTPS